MSQPPPVEPSLVPLAQPLNVRFTWNAFPNNAKPPKPPLGQHGPHGCDLPRTVVPLAAIYSPMSDAETVPMVVGEPPRCRTCHAVWSCHSQVDVQSKFWSCASCLSRNPLPEDFNPDHPALSQASVDYVMPTQVFSPSGRTEPKESDIPPPLFVYIIDTCVSHEELTALKAGLVRSLEWLPPNALVGVISFGRSVTVWETGFSDMSKCFVLRGNRNYEETDLLTMLNVGPDTPIVGRFFIPLEECEFVISSILEELTPDPFPVPNGTRPDRCTGTALQLALSLSEFSQRTHLGGKPNSFCGGKMMLFVGGPCTRGPGSIATLDRGDLIRSHRDLMEGDAPLHDDAVAFYAKINKRLSKASCCLDCITASFDQVGILELRACVNETGGRFICCDTFDHTMFHESLRRHFLRCDFSTHESRAPKAGFGATLSVYTSVDTLISGAIGPVQHEESTEGNGKERSHRHDRGQSPVEIGCPGTHWSLSQVDLSTAVTVIFDAETGGDSGHKRFIQFALEYSSTNGERHVRITSIAQPIASNDHTANDFHSAFDQECAAAVVAKIAVSTLDLAHNKYEMTKRWLDRLLVKFVRRYGRYRVGDPDSLQLSATFSLFPILLYNLRRSEYFIWLNISPDETAFKRHFLLHEGCENTLLMMQPTLMQYTMESATARAVPLDSSSITADSILLMDAFFTVHIMWGQTIEAWKEANYQELPEYSHFKTLLDAPEADLATVLETRFPYPRYSRTGVNGGEARHIKTRVNPSSNYSSPSYGQGQGPQAGQGQQGQTTIYTDDASISRFMQTLKQAVVAPEES